MRAAAFLHAAAAAIGPTYNRYLVASALALALDTAVFILSLATGTTPVRASAIGYLCGIAAHWLLSTRFVFAHGVASAGFARARQKGLFVATAFLGLAITTAIVGIAHQAGQHPLLAKVIAVAVSFQATYLARRAAIFRA